jgi:uncharacterized membrane protein YdbT with pleckstrin-like domain
VQLLDSFRSSTWGWLRGTLRGWSTLLLILAGVVGLAAGSAYGLGAWTLLLSGAGVAIIIRKWIASLAARYDVTEDRLIIHRGILMKSIDEIEMYRIKDIRIDFSLISQMVGLGTITINSSDETTRAGPLALRDIEQAMKRREMLRGLVDAARRARGVREIDVGHEEN